MAYGRSAWSLEEVGRAREGDGGEGMMEDGGPAEGEVVAMGSIGDAGDDGYDFALDLDMDVGYD